MKEFLALFERESHLLVTHSGGMAILHPVCFLFGYVMHCQLNIVIAECISMRL